ncbi:hypothetical protein GF351_01150 [Candidatus Woesearchaeota archaeon]|nr:hypothetical protein [Candidatus Woesearchaeota archaeon]
MKDMIKEIIVIAACMMLVIVAGCGEEVSPQQDTETKDTMVMPEPDEDSDGMSGGGTEETGGQDSSGITDDLEALLEKGAEAECTAKVTVEGEGTVTAKFWIKGQKERIEVDTQEGASNSIMDMDDKQMWTWLEGSQQGIMMDIGKMEEMSESMDTASQQTGAEVKSAQEWNKQAMNIDCKETSVPDSMFVPPSDVDFTDFTAMLEQMMGMT